jgi:hypothetical protein
LSPRGTPVAGATVAAREEWGVPWNTRGRKMATRGRGQEARPVLLLAWHGASRRMQLHSMQWLCLLHGCNWLVHRTAPHLRRWTAVRTLPWTAAQTVVHRSLAGWWRGAASPCRRCHCSRPRPHYLPRRRPCWCRCQSRLMGMMRRLCRQQTARHTAEEQRAPAGDSCLLDSDVS